MPKKPEGIVLYDFLQVRGGAEAVTLDIVDALSAATLCVGFVSGDFAREGIGRGRFELRILGRPVALSALQYVQGLFLFRHRTAFLGRFAWALYSGSNAPTAIRHHPAGLNVLYCHTPPRFVYDLKAYWLQRAAWWQRPLLKLLAWYVKRRYEEAVRRMDLVIANSENVRQRLLRYLGRDSVVVHPPCDTSRFRWISQDDYYLSTARLEPYKRVDRVVRAFLRMPHMKLVVCSGGSELDALRRLAQGADNIRFTGWISAEESSDLVGRSIATVYIPLDEDFGMSPVESMAAGKPVIGVAAGGLLETVIPGETGILLPADPSVHEIEEAVRRMTPALALTMREACEERARAFSKEVFGERIRALLALEGEA